MGPTRGRRPRTMAMRRGTASPFTDDDDRVKPVEVDQDPWPVGLVTRPLGNTRLLATYDRRLWPFLTLVLVLPDPVRCRLP
ncbi:MAG: hypothetical protein AVDCRST_MAG34-300 [uncultured Nocardioidaceae bacterium]|uniref:Uncharacterized protein n=1 Tax=uncultured Nocardioidaceae bacterium TaxID=253824 RepID=A0A6J4LCC1_9ACTN|nr:MAG: hypothetical protein AVDCRST_MAG34-300 [uncultured Nocardioidaceae bacterium]